MLRAHLAHVLAGFAELDRLRGGEGFGLILRGLFKRLDLGVAAEFRAEALEDIGLVALATWRNLGCVSPELQA